MVQESVRKNNITGEWEHLVTFNNQTYWAQGLTGNVKLKNEFTQNDVAIYNSVGDLLVYENVQYNQPITVATIIIPTITSAPSFEVANVNYNSFIAAKEAERLAAIELAELARLAELKRLKDLEDSLSKDLPGLGGTDNNTGVADVVVVDDIVPDVRDIKTVDSLNRTE